MSENQQDQNRSVGGQENNQNAAKARIIYNTMMRAVTQEEFKRVRAMTEAILNQAANGERWASEFVRDTLDGRPKQQIEQSGPDGGPIAASIELRFLSSE